MVTDLLTFSSSGPPCQPLDLFPERDCCKAENAGAGAVQNKKRALPHMIGSADLYQLSSIQDAGGYNRLKRREYARLHLCASFVDAYRANITLYWQVPAIYEHCATSNTAPSPTSTILRKPQQR